MKSPYAYFKITEKAGRFVAGRNNTGVGTELLLSRREAEYDVNLGALTEVGSTTAAAAETDVDPAKDVEPVDLSKLTKAELLALAQERGIEADEKGTKAEIIAALVSAV